ncbi:hypothetical protein EE612_032392 [Oryza sativa]|nr:hypothetical protein EE612_032392 [Oryza sativa]KAB8101547.1 hypothetical protein EE612_032392 [Oryza sativa]KAB8101548.1 hypothetical protein EE612_032392 [Oryza sativa]
MGLSRRFLNLIVDNRIPGAKSLRCIDLTLARYKLFNTTTPAALILNGKISESERPQDSTPWAGADNNGKEAAATLKIGTIQLPTPIMNFRSSAEYLSWYINCIPLAGRKVLCTDQSGRACLFDADTCKVDTLPLSTSPSVCPTPSSSPVPMTRTTTTTIVMEVAASTSWILVLITYQETTYS